jgi:hypothetical protein
MLELPPCSPIPVPNDIFLFAEKKEILKGRHFDDTDDIRINTTAALQKISQNHFQYRFDR